MKREVKIGIFAVAMILAAWAGVRFLKGFDIFGRNAVYYAAYDQVGGVQSASPVLMQGVKIGTVTGITLDPRRSDKVVLQLTVKRQYAIPEDSEAKIISNSLMGSKAIEITYGTSERCLADGDTLISSRDRDLMDMAGSELDFFKQKLSRITDDLSRTLGNINGLLEENAANISGTLGNLNTVSGDVAELLDTEKEHLQSAVRNLFGLCRHARRERSARGQHRRQPERGYGAAGRGGFLRSAFRRAWPRLTTCSGKINAGEGSLGMLLNDRALYDSLTVASGNLASLLADLERYPGRYVHFSLFGRDPEKMKTKADRRAAREAEKQLKDSPDAPGRRAFRFPRLRYRYSPALRAGDGMKISDMIYPATFEQKIGFDRLREQVAALCSMRAARERLRRSVFQPRHGRSGSGWRSRTRCVCCSRWNATFPAATIPISTFWLPSCASRGRSSMSRR